MLTVERPTFSTRQLNVMGTRCHTIIPGKRTEGKLAVIQVEVDRSGTGVPEHIHDLEDEKLRVLEGKVRFTLGAREVILNAGEAIVGPRGIPHSWTAIEPSLIMVCVTPSGLEELYVDIDAIGNQHSDLSKVIEACERYSIRFTGKLHQ